MNDAELIRRIETLLYGDAAVSEMQPPQSDDRAAYEADGVDDLVTRIALALHNEATDGESSDVTKCETCRARAVKLLPAIVAFVGDWIGQEARCTERGMPVAQSTGETLKAQWESEMQR